MSELLQIVKSDGGVVVEKAEFSNIPEVGDIISIGKELFGPVTGRFWRLEKDDSGTLLVVTAVVV